RPEDAGLDHRRPARGGDVHLRPERGRLAPHGARGRGEDPAQELRDGRRLPPAEEALMRHLILTLDFPPLYDGGIARSMDETARALAGAGQSVRVLTRGKGGDVAKHDASYPAAVTRFWGHHWQKFHPWLLAWHLP